MKREEPKDDDYIISPCLRKGLKISTHVLMKTYESKMRVLL